MAETTPAKKVWLASNDNAIIEVGESALQLSMCAV